MKTLYTTFLLLLLAATNTFAQIPPSPQNVIATAFERHIELKWQSSTGANSYKIYRSENGGADFTFLKSVPNNFALDWTGDEGTLISRHYKVTAANVINLESAPSETVSGTTRNMNLDELTDMVQESTFRYFWEFGHPVSGMARERSNGNGEVIATGGTGFGIMAICVAVENGWITRDQALNRLIQIASFLQIADRFHGAYPHWMNGTTGDVIPFSQFDDGADLVETAYLIQGLLTARQFFDQNTPLESALRDVITGIWEDVEWDWFRRNNSSVLYWHWSPNFGWQMNFQLRGFNETMIVYLLAVASPTHSVPASLYHSGWASGNYVSQSIYYGYPIYCGPFAGGPLFFAHYSYLGFDPRNKKDQYCNYFKRNTNHTLINRQYCIANPEQHEGYNTECWGLTASDDPGGYLAHDPFPTNDNGTISPTAALSSMPYTPAESKTALAHFYRNYGERLYGIYGFHDAFNPDANWVANSFLAIDQGPIICMIENYKTGLLWEKFMQNPEISPALAAIGFVPDLVDTETPSGYSSKYSVIISPNPVLGNFNLAINGVKNAPLVVSVFDAFGREKAVDFVEKSGAEQTINLAFDAHDWVAGVYYVQVQIEGEMIVVKKIVCL